MMLENIENFSQTMQSLQVHAILITAIAKAKPNNFSLIRVSLRPPKGGYPYCKNSETLECSWERLECVTIYLIGDKF